MEITDRGRPVALLTPIPQGGPLERMRAADEIGIAAGSVADLPDPLPLPVGAESPSDALARLRSDER